VTDQVDKQFGRLNPHAPPELSRFAFLIGSWRCAARLQVSEGEWQNFDALWTGRYILDGYAIADEYRMTDATGKLVVLGMNFRVYDVARHAWQIRWLNALAGTWLELGADELGGVQVDNQTVSYVFRETVAGHAYTRASYTSESPAHFTWRGEKSEDRLNWTEFMVAEADRMEP
jgi:hypothetical protein